MHTTQTNRRTVPLGRLLTWPAVVLAPVLVFGGCGGQSGEEDTATTAAAKAISRNNLKMLSLAMHAYAQSLDGQLPSSAWIDLGERGRLGNIELPSDQLAKSTATSGGKPLPLLSWRVGLLPYLEQQDLYKKFHLNEPWDSGHNKKLLAEMPKLYAPVRGTTKEPYSTYYQVFVGPDAPFNGTIRPRLPASFVHGLQKTFLIVEAGEAVPWTKPEDIPYHAKNPLPKLGGLFSDGFTVALADGFVRFVPRSVPESTLRAWIDPRSPEPVPDLPP